MFQKNYIMAQEKINYMHNTKEVQVSLAWENSVSAHGAAKAKNKGSLGSFFSPYFINIMSS